MGTTTNKLSYLKETKEKIAEKIIDLGGDITDNTTFREYANELQAMYDNANKVSAEGSNIKLENCAKGKMIIQPKGNTTQNDGASPDNPQTIKNVTGNNKVKISGKNQLAIENIDTSVAEYGYTCNIKFNAGEVVLNGNYSQSFSLTTPIKKSNYVSNMTDVPTFPLSADTYTLSIQNIQNAPNNVFLLGYKIENETKTYIGAIELTNPTIKTFTVNDSADVFFGIQCNSLVTFDNTSFDIMLEKGTTQTEYEPYIEPIEKELNLTGYTLMEDDYITEDCVIHHQETTETIPENTTLYNQVKELYRTIIEVPTIIIETESDVDNAQLIVNASALKSSEDNEN